MKEIIWIHPLWISVIRLSSMSLIQSGWVGKAKDSYSQGQLQLWTELCTPLSVWECSVHICRCPWKGPSGLLFWRPGPNYPLVLLLFLHCPFSSWRVWSLLKLNRIIIILTTTVFLLEQKALSWSWAVWFIGILTGWSGAEIECTVYAAMTKLPINKFKQVMQSSDAKQTTGTKSLLP